MAGIQQAEELARELESQLTSAKTQVSEIKNLKIELSVEAVTSFLF